MHPVMQDRTNASLSPTAPAEHVDDGVFRVAGAPGSPYTRKLLGLLRYRRIPYRYITRGGEHDKGLARYAPRNRQQALFACRNCPPATVPCPPPPLNQLSTNSQGPRLTQ
jgi:hypothetical protein